MGSVSEPRFKQLQAQFAGHIRDPQVPVIDGIEDRRMQIYRDLFFNNVEGFTASAFPVAKRIMGESWWQQAVRDFLRDYRCSTPYFNEISKEFLTFVSEVRPKQASEPDFLTELMHYEWVELALDIAIAEPFKDTTAFSAPLLEGEPVLSPLAWSLSYRYPVHQIGEQSLPEAPPEQPTWLMVYRDRNDNVQFMVLNALTARLIDLIHQNAGRSGREILLQIAAEMGATDAEHIVQAGLQILEQFYSVGILLGARLAEGK